MAKSTKPKKVLIVEDDKAILDILAYKISDVGFAVIQTQDGVEGLRLALAEHPDLVILDLLVPGAPGLDIIDSLRKDPWGKHVPVFILTNLSAYGTIYKTLELRAEAYFIKSDSTLESIAGEVKKRLS